MTLQKMIVCGLVVAATSGCAVHRPAVKIDPVTRQEQLVPVPGEVGKLSIAERHVYEDTGGVRYRYGGELIYSVDVFVYPLNKVQEQTLIDVGEAELLIDEYRQFRAELQYAIEQGWYDAAEPAGQKLAYWEATMSLDDREVAVPFNVLRAELDITRHQREFDSFVAIAEFNGYLVKLRMTAPEFPGLEREMADFTQRFFHALYSRDRRFETISVGSGNDRTEVLCLPGQSLRECAARATDAERAQTTP